MFRQAQHDTIMNLERYTEKAQSILQSSQTLALGSGHQKFLPEHILQAMLEDSDLLAAKIINLCDGNVEILKAENSQSLKKLPQVEGSQNLSMSQELARIFLLAEKLSIEDSQLMDFNFRLIPFKVKYVTQSSRR